MRSFRSTSPFILVLLLVAEPAGAGGPAQAEHTMCTEPLARTTVTFDEAWRFGTDDDPVLFGEPVQARVGPKGKVYVLDAQLSQVVVLSPDGKFIRTIGREGEGPGEFRGAADMVVWPDGRILVNCGAPGKMVCFAADGTPVDNFMPVGVSEGTPMYLRVEAGPSGAIVLCGATTAMEGRHLTQTTYLASFDADGTERVRFHEATLEGDFGSTTYDEPTFTGFKGQWSASPTGEVAAALDFDAYRIHVWAPDGTPVRIIERPGYEPVVRTEEERDRFQERYDHVTSWNPGSTFRISDTHRAIVKMWYRDDGTLWVLPGDAVWRAEDGTFAVFDVYDNDGKYIERVAVRGEGNAESDGLYLDAGYLFRVPGQYQREAGGDEDYASDGLVLIACRLPEVAHTQ